LQRRRSRHDIGLVCNLQSQAQTHAVLVIGEVIQVNKYSVLVIYFIEEESKHAALRSRSRLDINHNNTPKWNNIVNPQTVSVKYT
jgi:hypothetical protein